MPTHPELVPAPEHRAQSGHHRRGPPRCPLDASSPADRHAELAAYAALREQPRTRAELLRIVSDHLVELHLGLPSPLDLARFAGRFRRRMGPCLTVSPPCGGKGATWSLSP